jgi:hypothetical protein
VILSKAQAEAVYAAMCALNSVNARVTVHFGDIATTGCNVFQLERTEVVRVAYVETFRTRRSEDYADQSEFAKTYGLAEPWR